METISNFSSSMDFLSIFVIAVPVIRFVLGITLAVLAIKCMLKYLKNN
ncbi:hypothetical protein [Anaerotignum sp. MB30-C6]|nr:hypothetical protein [Anaerotignum sp. MB30-C6]WMI81401.1 hypothetical protein RBQ60_01325 [Anaerotignum sp. MB30-C6]